MSVYCEHEVLGNEDLLFKNALTGAETHCNQGVCKAMEDPFIHLKGVKALLFSFFSRDSLVKRK